jgi:hypothetical protein
LNAGKSLGAPWLGDLPISLALPGTALSNLTDFPARRNPNANESRRTDAATSSVVLVQLNAEGAESQVR